MARFIIYGTGSIAREKYEQVTNEYGNDCVECFIDSMLSKKCFCGKKVIRPEQLKKYNVNEYTYLLGTLTSKQSMISELAKHGVSIKNIVNNKDYGSNSFEDNVRTINRILLYPDINDSEILNNIDEQFTAMVPNLKQLIHKPEFMSKSIQNDTVCLKRIEEIKNIKGYDLVLVWDKEQLANEELNEVENVYCIDPYFFRMINIRIFLRINLLLESSDNKRKYKKESIKNYTLFSQKHNGQDSYIFGAGPSCKNGADKLTNDNTIRIVCNNFVDNEELIEKINPNIYVLSEEDSMSQGYWQLIEKIYSYIKENECLFVVPNILGAVLVERYPDIISNLVRVSFDTKNINFPSPENMSVYRKAYNVITLLAIPVASYLSELIYISGCDGVDLEKYDERDDLWSHDDKLDSNKSFKFSIRVNEDNWKKEYYIKHINYFEEVLTYGEKIGKKYIPYTYSNIEGLKRRM